MHGYEVVARAVADQGTDVVFGLIGHGNMHFLNCWVARGHRYFAARHENQAVAMARGYSLSTGEPAVATVTHGPGITNAATAMTACARGRIPLVLVTGDTATTSRGRLQDIDHAAVVAPTGAHFLDVREPENLESTVHEAFSRAMSDRRPVVVNAPLDVLETEVWSSAPPLHERLSDVPPHLLSEPDRNEINAAIDRLVSCHAPLVIAGRGAVFSGARQALVALAERIGGLLGTTVPAHGLFHGNAFDAGVIGGYGRPEVRGLCGDIDVIVAFGASMHPRTTGGGTLFPRDPTLIHVDVSRDAIGHYSSPEVAVIGDAGIVAEAMLAELELRGFKSGGLRNPAVSDRLKRASPQWPAERGASDVVHPRDLVLALDSLLPDERTLIVDGGHCTGWASIDMRTGDEKSYQIATGDFGSIGLGLGGAIGAAVGRPDRLATLLIGDGSLMMSLGDLETLARHRIPLLTIVMNDNAYGSEVHSGAVIGLPPELGSFDNPSFAEIATAMGIPAWTVRRLDDLKPLREHLPLDGPVLVDCQLDADVVGPWMEAMAREAHPRSQGSS